MSAVRKEETEAQSSYAKAAQAELAQNWDVAYRLYIKSTEAYLHLRRITTDETARKRYQAGATKALDRAEKIKAVKKSVLSPIAVDAFSDEEQTRVLDNGAVINGVRYHSWSLQSAAATIAKDLEQPPLCNDQVSHGATWKSAKDVWPSTAFDFSIPARQIQQRVVSDCSVCAAIAVCIEHHRRFESRLGFSCLFPHNSSGLPYATTDGRYCVRLTLNGVMRQTDVDDKLPFSSAEPYKLLCMTTELTHQTWPALIEKAYLRVMGGYEFAGSDSSTDIHAFAGWIPEHVDITGPAFARHRMWDRLLRAFKKGQCVLTLGTGEADPPAWEGAQLLPAHCYAVIDAEEADDGEQYLTFLDPWVAQSGAEHSELEAEFANLSTDDVAIREIRIPYDDVCELFQGIYLSWNPAIFSHNLIFHGSWKPERISDDDSFAALAHLQLDISQIFDEEDVWVLLTRHIKETRTESGFISLQAHLKDDTKHGHSDASHLALQGDFTNKTHTLARIRIGPSTSPMAISLLAAYESGLEGDIGFTATIYSNLALSWSRPQQFPFVHDISDSFTTATSGGHSGYPSFMINPQYRLTVHPPSGRPSSANQVRVEATARAARTLPVNVVAVWANGVRVFELSENEVAMGSGTYKYGVASAHATLTPGVYTLVVSAHTPRHLGPFVLNVKATSKIDVVPIQPEGAGMYARPLRGEWSGGSAAGSPAFRRYGANPAFAVVLPTAAQIFVRAQLADVGPPVPSNVSLFTQPKQGQPIVLDKPVVTSGPYADARAGVVTEPIALAPGRYVLIVSTYAPSVERAFRAMVYSSVGGVSVAADVELSRE